MRKGSKGELTPKEEEVMQLLWANGPIQISKLVELYPDPKPHVNTVSTVVRRLEGKGFVSHNEWRGRSITSPPCRKRIFATAVSAISSRTISAEAITARCRH